MIFTKQWIREWVECDLTPDALISQLTMAGLEVDASGAVAADFSDVIVAEVHSIEQHPDADKLRVCHVFDGVQIHQVVCGADNVRPGLKVPYARVGARLPVKSPERDAATAFTIKKAKLRGIESFGMLCSADELGLSENSEGLLELPADAPVGTCVREFLQLEDVFFEMDLTPNRGDCLSIRGLAREISALNNLAYHEPAVTAVTVTTDAIFTVDVKATQQCPRYVGRVIKDIDINIKTPLWMQERLRRCGLRSIDPVVDVTNYVLLELGQPMHAFDLQRLNGGITVRMAEAGEKITLLDGKQIDVQSDILLITDEQGPLALAGIMGGQHSGVSAETCDIFLECAWFDPLAIAGKARRHGLHTDASHRYERGVDSGLQFHAMERATQLLLQIVGGDAGPLVVCEHDMPAQKFVNLQINNISRLLGMTMSIENIINILSRLGLLLQSSDETQLDFLIPSHRFDISIEADLIEELARVYGYEHLPVTQPLVRMNLSPQAEGIVTPERLRERLVTLGYQQVITYSFVEQSVLALLQPDIKPVALQNPISADMAVMRTSLWAGLIHTLRYNVNRQQTRVRLFETGQIFLPSDNLINQPEMLGGLIYGSRMPAEWAHTGDFADFYDVKGDLEVLLALSGDPHQFTFEAMPHPALQSGQSAQIFKSGRAVGWIGALSPAIQRALYLSDKVYLFEIELASVLTARTPSFKALSKFPEVSRDIALLLDKQIPAQTIRAALSELAGEYLTSLRIFDVYQGDAIGSEKKSMALGLTWQHPSRTLGEDDINSIIDRCVKGLEVKFNAKLRN